MSITLLQLKEKIKAWEHDFQKKHRRVPAKQDMKLEPEISDLYKQYRLLKGTKKPATSRKPAVLERKRTFAVDVGGFLSESDNSDENDESNATKIEMAGAQLGPTPQANGKVLSIFDLKLTPPESSPLKSKVLSIPEMKHDAVEDGLFKTPTKIRKLNFMDLTPTIHKTPTRNLSSKLQMISETSDSALLATPAYLSRNTQKFSFDDSDSATINSSPFVASPSPQVEQDTPIEPETPTKRTPEGFLLSPSPLKTHRFLSYGSNKKISDIFHDFKNSAIGDDEAEEFEGEFIDEEEELVTGDADGLSVKRKKQITQKRTTRRWKIKPRQDNTGEDQLEGKDIHEEVRKLDEKAQQKLDEYIEGSTEAKDEKPEEDSDGEYKRPQASTSTKGKVKPMSNNYQRLKINDPRTRAFKRRMGRR